MGGDDDSLDEWRRKYTRRERERGGLHEWKGGTKTA